MVISVMAFFLEQNSWTKFEQSYKGCIRKNPRIHPNYHSCDFPQKWQFRPEIENFEISRNSAYSNHTPYKKQPVENWLCLYSIWIVQYDWNCFKIGSQDIGD